MFETYLDDEINYPYLDSLDGKNLWNTIKLSFDKYWFIVEVISNSNDGLLKNSFMVADVEKLLDFKHKQNFEIHNLYLVHSGWFDNKEGWKIEELSEVWKSMEPNPNYEQISYIFILKNQSRYIDSSISTPEEELCNKKLLLKLMT